MGLFDKVNNKKQKNMISILLNLNARLQPIHRGEIFEDLFEEVLSKYQIGEVVGGGTLQKPTGEIENCDIEMLISRDKLNNFISFLHQIDIIPKGSKLVVGDEEIEIGCAEGLALYLNGTDLPAEIYQNCDINYLIEQLDSVLEGVGQRLSHWEGGSETALYYYGGSYPEMKNKIAAIVQEYPLCEKCRIEQIA